MKKLIIKLLFAFISCSLVQISVASAAVIASATEQGMTTFLYDDACQIPKLASKFPWRWDVKNASTKQNLAQGCYSIDRPSQMVILADTNNNGGRVSFAEFGLVNSNQNQQSALGATADFFNSLANGISGAQKFQQPPPGFVYIPPGITRSNYMTCTPDGRGGYYCK